jgi:hypothetical protein
MDSYVSKGNITFIFRIGFDGGKSSSVFFRKFGIHLDDWIFHKSNEDTL